jgi:enoyl-CoA hydratase
MSEENLVLTELHGKVGLVTLNRPQVFNSLNLAFLTAIMDTLLALDQDVRVGALVICGNRRFFSIGVDVKEMLGATTVDMLQVDPVRQFDRIRLLEKPVIAAVSGWCLGCGCELAISCDMIIASETAKFGQPELNLGVIPGAGATQRLARTLGKHLAMEVILNNRILTAEEALRFGLVKS